MAGRGEEEVDFVRPPVPEWRVFEEAALKLYYNWEITQHALDDEWANGLTEDYCDRVIDFLLANFAERWIEGKPTKMHAVSDFLVDTLDDHFEVELTTDVTLPLARVLVTLYEECRVKVFTGVNHVLGAEAVGLILQAETGRQVVQPPAPVISKPAEQAQSEASPAPMEAGSGNDSSAQAGPAEGSKDVAAPPPPEDDGWTTVPAKKSKKKGKQFE